MTSLEKIYSKVSGIVHRTRKDYYIQLWSKEDWDQEGMIILNELLQRYPTLPEDEDQLYRYFKTKFRNYVVDQVRKQESFKRRINRQPYEEISEVSHRVSLREMVMEDRMVLRELLGSYRRQLSPIEQEQYDLLISGSSFRGRKAMLRDLSVYLKDFNPKNS